MNLRILKKLSKRAVPVLVALGHKGEFFPAAHALTGENYHGFLILARKHWDRSGCHPSFEGRKGQYSTKGADDIRYVTRAGSHMVMRPPSHPLKGTMMIGWVSGGEQPEWDEECAYRLLLDQIHSHFTDWGAYPDPLPTRRIRSVSDVFVAAADMIEEYNIDRADRAVEQRKAA